MSAQSQNEENSGISGTHVMKGTIVFSLVAGAYVAVLWGACFVFSPAQRVVNRLPWKYVKDAYKTGMEKAAKSPFLQRFPEEYRGKIMVSFGEMLTMKVILGPFGLPFKLWLTYEIMKFV